MVLIGVTSVRNGHTEKLRSVDQIRILGIGLELACNEGSCGGISLKRDLFPICNTIDSMHYPQLQASSSPIPRIREWYIGWILKLCLPFNAMQPPRQTILDPLKLFNPPHA